MDSLTQATLGAAIGEALLGKKIGNKGTILGAIIATIPDFDVALKPFYSNLQSISIHRGYRAPTAFYFEITTGESGKYKLSSAMHQKRIKK
jgi:inner membrane protein